MARRSTAPKITDALGRERKATRASWGKVRTLKSGRIQASYVGPDGQRYPAPLTFDNKGDAEQWLAQARADIARGAWVSPAERAAAKAERSQTLGDYATTWLATRDLKPRTLDEYRRLLAGPLADLRGIVLSALTPAKVRAWHGAQLASGRKTQAARAYGLLNAIMRTALGDGLIDANPCRVDGAQSKSTGRMVKPPTDAELEVILNAITPRYKALVSIAAAGGLRYGEATALRAKDVVVERAEDGALTAVRLNVERGVVRTAEGIVPGTTKSEAGVRKVAIFGDDAQIVAEHVRGLIGDALLFPAADGVGFLAQSAFWKHWNPARTSAGRSDMPFHALRHYAGTRYAQAGATPRETMARLGHSSIGAAMRYQHAGDRDDELAARMARRSS